MEAVVAHRKLFHDVEHHQRRNSLGVRRNLINRPAAILGRNRRHPLGLKAGQVLHRHGAALFAADGNDRFSRASLVVAVAAIAGDHPQARRQFGIAKHLARLRRASVDQVRGRRVSLRAQQFERVVPQSGRHLVHRKSFVGIKNSRRQQGGKRQAAKALAQRCPAGDDARHRHAVHAARRQLRYALRLQKPGSHTSRCPSARIQPVQLARLGFVDDGEKISADAVAGRLHHANHGIGRNRRVDRVPAALQNLHAGHRRQRLAAGNNAVSSGNDRTSRLGQSRPGRGPQCVRFLACWGGSDLGTDESRVTHEHLQ